MTPTMDEASTGGRGPAERNAEVVRRYLGTYLTRDLHALAEVMAEDVEAFGSNQYVRGRQVVADVVTTPGLTCVAVDVVELVAMQDRVAVYVLMTWRQDRTGVEVVQSATKIYQVRDGKIVRFWGDQDTLGLMQGLDLVPRAPIDFA